MTDLIVVHSTRSGLDNLAREYEITIRYMMTPGTVSSHWVVGHEWGQWCQLVADGVIAWHATTLNPISVSVEVCQPKPDDPYSDWQYMATAHIVAEWMQEYGLGKEQVVGHEDTWQGQNWHKSDPGPMWDWGRFWREVERW